MWGRQWGLGWNVELPHGQTMTGVPIIHPSGNQGACYYHSAVRAQGDRGAEMHICQSAMGMGGITSEDEGADSLGLGQSPCALHL